MNKHIKKLLSIALAIVMLLSAIPLTSIIGNVGFLPTAEAATVTKTQVENKLDKIAKEYPTKSYFSKNGLSCGHASGKSCKNCHLTDILNAKKSLYRNIIMTVGLVGLMRLTVSLNVSTVPCTAATTPLKKLKQAL